MLQTLIYELQGRAGRIMEAWRRDKGNERDLEERRSLRQGRGGAKRGKELQSLEDCSTC